MTKTRATYALLWGLIIISAAYAIGAAYVHALRFESSERAEEVQHEI